MIVYSYILINRLIIFPNQENGTLFVPIEPLNGHSHHSGTCEITPGCSYLIEVGSDNSESKLNYKVPGKFSKTLQFVYLNNVCTNGLNTDCVGKICSCQHAMGLPNVKTKAKVDSQMMLISWEINGSYSIPSDIKVYIIVK